MENNLGITGLDIKTLISALEDALAEEYLAWYAYSIEAPFLTGNNHLEIEELFKKTAKDEFEDHAYWLMDRINKLGGNPARILHPDWLNRKATHKYIMPKAPFNVIDAIDRNIKAEKGAIETYTKLEAMTRDKDIVTNNKVKEILADEQDHLQDLLEWKDACQSGRSISSKRNGGNLNYANYLKSGGEITKYLWGGPSTYLLHENLPSSRKMASLALFGLAPAVTLGVGALGGPINGIGAGAITNIAGFAVSPEFADKRLREKDLGFDLKTYEAWRQKRLANRTPEEIKQARKNYLHEMWTPNPTESLDPIYLEYMDLLEQAQKDKGVYRIQSNE